MGAGKTTLIRAICQLLGVKSPVQSPTFSIVLPYTGEKCFIYHFDCYRLESKEDFFSIGGHEYLYSGEYCFLEWAENIKEVFDTPVLNIHIEFMNETERKLTAAYINL